MEVKYAENNKLFIPVFLTARVYILLGLVAALFVVSFYINWKPAIANSILVGVIVFIVSDIVMVSLLAKSVEAKRLVKEDLSLGDEVHVEVKLEKKSNMPIRLKLEEEAPIQFQLRDFGYTKRMYGKKKAFVFDYTITPKERGDYFFGNINLYYRSPLGLAEFKKVVEAEEMFKVYPSVKQMKRAQLMLNGRSRGEVKRTRRVGHSTEFEQIREYVLGDDPKHINWSGTARRNSLMVNQYQELKSQDVYIALDKGRSMERSFDGMTQLDYSINACLALYNVILHKKDKAGFISFDHQVGTIEKAQNKKGQLRKMSHQLYNQETSFLEANYEAFYYHLRRQVKTRSLILLFCDFNSYASFERNLPYLRSIAKMHKLVVIFFKNYDLEEVLYSSVTTDKEIYDKAVAGYLTYEKEKIKIALEQNGISVVMTSPEKLSIDSINEYLALKEQGVA